MKKLSEFGREWKYKIKDFFARPTLKEYINGRYKSFLAYQEARKEKVPLGHWIALGIVIAGFIGLFVYYYHNYLVAEYYKTHTLEVEPLYQPATEYIESMNKKVKVATEVEAEVPQEVQSPSSLINKYFRPEDRQVAYAVMMAESGGNPTATNYNTNGTTDKGLFQINTIHGHKSTYDPELNVRYASEIRYSWGSWNAWSVFKSGRYLRFM